MSTDTRNENFQELLIWVIDCIGGVSRVYPVGARDRLLGIFEPIQGILKTSNRELLTPKLEETCLRTLIWTGHHLQVLANFERRKYFDYIGARSQILHYLLT